MKRLKYEINRTYGGQNNRHRKIISVIPAENRRSTGDKPEENYRFAVKITEIIFILNLAFSDAENKVIFLLFEYEKAESGNNHAHGKPCNIDIDVHFSSFLPFANGMPLNIKITARIKLTIKQTSDRICVEKYA